MSDIWKRKNKADKALYNIATTMGRRLIKGDVGLEVECEGNKFPKEQIVSPWGYHHDGSLRGADNAEYVLNKPVLFEEVSKVVTDLWTMLDKFGTKLDVSNRTSVHVHLNCQQFHINRVAAFTAIYFIFEGLLTDWCGEHRVGNLFCLRAKDAPAIITETRNFIKYGGEYHLNDNLHYAGLNIQALAKFGSIEVRTLQGVVTPEPIIFWVSLLERLYKVSDDFKDPRHICSLFSAEGPIAFYDKMLGDFGRKLREELSLTDDYIREEMYEGLRMAQDICYARDWDAFSPTEVTPDPFGRDPRKKMLNSTGVGIGLGATAPPIGPEVTAFMATINSFSPVDEWLHEEYSEE